MATNSTRAQRVQESQRRHEQQREAQHDQAHRHEPEHGTSSPFSMMRQGIDEMERWFSRVTGGARGRSASSWMSPSSWTPTASWMSPSAWMPSAGAQGDWAPPLEAFQRGSEFVVRLEVPGMNRTDLEVETGDDSLTIRGERKQEHHEEREGLFWSERSYGSFCRVVPLPSGAIAESAKATFNNGVLEIVMQAPSQEHRRGRRVDISGQA
jgi:HSP20 family protein